MLPTVQPVAVAVQQEHSVREQAVETDMVIAADEHHTAAADEHRIAAVVAVPVQWELPAAAQAVGTDTVIVADEHRIAAAGAVPVQRELPAAAQAVETDTATVAD